MILIERGTQNTVALSLKEKATLCPPTSFLFCFKSIQENREVCFIAADISLAPLRYNKFVIEENDVEDKVNGVVKLNPEGFWTYIIYEQTSATNLIPTDAAVVGIVETGRVKVIGVNQEYDRHDPANNEFIAHEPS